MIRTLILGLLAGTCLCSSAWGNGQEENRSWQFRTTGDRLNNAYVLDIIQRKKNGYYDNLDTTNNYTTNFAGDQINCTVQASATGNLATNTQDGQAGNANIVPAVHNSAEVIGNTADNTVTTSASLVNSVDNVGSATTLDNLTNSGGSNNTGSDFSIGSDDNNTYSPNGPNYNAQDLLTNGQSNTDSTLTAGASNNTSNVTVGTTTTSGTVNQALNNNQTNSGTQTAQVTDSQGCTFTGK